MKRIIISILLSFSSLTFASGNIHNHGYWEDESGHITDWALADALVDFFKNEKAKTIVDFGCGKGDYVKHLLGADFICEGYDGNPLTEKMSDGVAKILDLSIRFDLKKQYDWVMSLEVGEHIPREFEKTLIDNIMRHAKNGIVLSWAVVGQGGKGHVNTRNNPYIKKIFAKHGWVNDVEAERSLRANSKLRWFKNTIMVFRRA